MLWSWLFDPDLIAHCDVAAANHLRQRTAAPVGRECRLKAGGNGFHATAWIALAGDLHHDVADAQQNTGLLRQIDTLDQQIDASFLPRNVTLQFRHGGIPVATFHQRYLTAPLAAGCYRAAKIAGNARLDRHTGVAEHLHRAFGPRMARNTGERAAHHRSFAVTPAKAGVSPLRGDASFRRDDG